MTRNLKPYSENKESGIPWLGEIPDHWELRRLGDTVTACINGIWGAEPNGRDDVMCVRVADFDRFRHRVRLTTPTLRAVSSSERRRRVLVKGDLLIEKSGGGDLQPVGVVVLYDHETLAVCSNFVARMPVAEGHSAGYLTYLHAHLYNIRLNTRSIKQTTGIQNLDSSAYLSETVALPPQQEQRAIVRFLDHADQSIRRYIRDKQKLIKLLQEQKQTVIHRAVTRGLDTKVRLKPSGREWLGDVPEHWDIVRIKQVARMESGHTPSRSVAEYWLDTNDIPWVSLNDTKQLSRVDYISDTALRVNELGLANSSARLLPGGAVVFTRDAAVGKAAITTRPMAVSQHLIAWLCGPRLLNGYLLKVFYAMKEELTRHTFGATIATIGMGDVRKLVTPLPPLDEQTRIVEHIDEACRVIEQNLKETEQLIKLANEYRTRLIADVVTGKLDVRQAAEQLPVETKEPDDLPLADDDLEDEEGADLTSGELAEEEVTA